MKLVGFGCWNLLKFTALSSYILACGVKLKHNINEYYNTTICTTCYSVAVNNPSVLYEWSACRMLPNTHSHHHALGVMIVIYGTFGK
jgi:hypothetical protein